jgi:hypothetical protein
MLLKEIAVTPARSHFFKCITYRFLQIYCLFSLTIIASEEKSDKIVIKDLLSPV